MTYFAKKHPFSSLYIHHCSRGQFLLALVLDATILRIIVSAGNAREDKLFKNIYYTVGALKVFTLLKPSVPDKDIPVDKANTQ